MLQATSPVLEYVQPGMHNLDDLDWIEKADAAQPQIERISLAEIDRALRAGTMHLFRLNPGPGAMLVEVRSDHGVRRLSLVRGAGRAAWQMRAILRQMGKIAKDWGCECVETVVYSKRLERALELAGASKEATVMTFSVETDDGQ